MAVVLFIVGRFYSTTTLSRYYTTLCSSAAIFAKLLNSPLPPSPFPPSPFSPRVGDILTVVIEVVRLQKIVFFADFHVGSQGHLAEVCKPLRTLHWHGYAGYSLLCVTFPPPSTK